MSKNGTINSFNCTCEEVFGISSSEVRRRKLKELETRVDRA